MAPTIPTKEPAQARAGETWAWTRNLSDYPAPAWSLSYRFYNADAAFTITALAGDPEHSVYVVPAVTTNYAPGTYNWAAQVTDGTDVYSVCGGALDILPDVVSAASYDGRGPWRQILDDLQTAYQRMLAGEIEAAKVSVNGRSVEYLNLESLIAAIKHAQQMVAQEEAENCLTGAAGGGGRIYVRF